MGLLVEGEWRTDGYDTARTGGRFVRQDSAFRDRVTADGSSGLRAEAGRYRLIVSLACPWASRTLIFRTLEGLENAVRLTIVDPLMGERGWILPDGRPLYELYRAVKPDYTGRVTVPVLWDDRTQRIVNNESAEIIRMLNSEFGPAGAHGPDFYPAELREDIDRVNERVYRNVNDGVYRAGFAATQDAYEEAVTALFETLDWLEERLAKRRYLVGDRITEADWRLFTTLVRFDAVYHVHFKCNVRRLVDYANLWAYTRDLYQVPGVAGTVSLDHIKRHYYGSHRTLNPHGIVPVGPEIDFDEPHRRDVAFG